MSKGKSIFLLIIISIITVALTVLTFVTIPFGGVKYFPSILSRIDLNSDFNNGSVYVLKLDEDMSEESEEINVDEVIEEVRGRLGYLGYTSAKVYAVRGAENEAYSLRLELDGKDSTDADVTAATAYGELNFINGDDDSIIMSGKDAITKASVEKSGEYYYAAMKLTEEAVATLTEFTGTLNIAVGDNDPILSQSSFDASQVISEDTIYLNCQDEAAARRYVLQFQGGMSTSYSIVEKESGLESAATMGDKSAMFMAIAIAGATLLAMIVIAILYKGFGLIADLAIYLFVLLEILFLVLVPGITVSASGIAGVGIATALVIYALVSIMEKTKKEYANGKTLKSAIKVSYSSLGLAYLDAVVCMGVAALAVFFLCSAGLQNLAITLGIGLVVGYIAGVLISRLLTAIFVGIVKKKEAFFNLRREDAE